MSQPLVLALSAVGRANRTQEPPTITVEDLLKSYNTQVPDVIDPDKFKRARAQPSGSRVATYYYDDVPMLRTVYQSDVALDSLDFRVASRDYDAYAELTAFAAILAHINVGLQFNPRSIAEAIHISHSQGLTAPLTTKSKNNATGADLVGLTMLVLSAMTRKRLLPTYASFPAQPNTRRRGLLVRAPMQGGRRDLYAPPKTPVSTVTTVLQARVPESDILRIEEASFSLSSSSSDDEDEDEIKK